MKLLLFIFFGSLAFDLVTRFTSTEAPTQVNIAKPPSDINLQPEYSEYAHIHDEHDHSHGSEGPAGVRISETNTGKEIKVDG